VSDAPAPSVADPSTIIGGQRIALTFTVLATTVGWSFQLISFLDAKEALLWAGVTWLALNSARSRAGVLPGFLHLGPCWCVAIAATLIGCLQGSAPALAFQEGLRLLPLLLAASLAWPIWSRPEGARQIAGALVVAALVTAFLALGQWAGILNGLFPAFPHYDQRMYSVFGNEGLLAGFMALGLVLAVGLPWAAPIRLAVIAPLVVVLILTGSRAGFLAAGSGLIALAVLRGGSGRGLVTALGFGALCLGLWGAVYPWIRSPDGVVTELRPWFWRGTWGMISHTFPWGAGLGQFSFAAPLHLAGAAPESGAGANLLVTEHAHFDGLEWVAETGLPGMIAGIWLLTRIRFNTPLAFAGLLSFAVFSCFHPAIHSAPHALAGLLLYALCVPASQRVAPTLSRRCQWLAHAGLLVIVALGVSAYLVTELRPSFLLRRAEDLHIAGLPAREAYEAAVADIAPHPEAWERYGIHLYEAGEYHAALAALLRAREYSDSGRLYRLLGHAAQAGGCPTAARVWYEACLRRWPWDERARREAEASLRRATVGPWAGD